MGREKGGPRTLANEGRTISGGGADASPCFYAIKSGPATRIITTSREDAQTLFTLFLNAGRSASAGENAPLATQPRQERGAVAAEEGRVSPSCSGREERDTKHQGVPLVADANIDTRGEGAPSREPTGRLEGQSETRFPPRLSPCEVRTPGAPSRPALSPAPLVFSQCASRPSSDAVAPSALSSASPLRPPLSSTACGEPSTQATHAGDACGARPGPADEIASGRGVDEATKPPGSAEALGATEGNKLKEGQRNGARGEDVRATPGGASFSWEIVRKASLCEALHWVAASFAADASEGEGREPGEREQPGETGGPARRADGDRKAPRAFAERRAATSGKLDEAPHARSAFLASGDVSSFPETGAQRGRRGGTLASQGGLSRKKRKLWTGLDDRPGALSISPEPHAGLRDVKEEARRPESSPSSAKTGDAASPADAASEERIVYIYTDGACRANGRGRQAKGGVGVFFGDGDPRNVSRRLAGQPQTNQRAELHAILDALLLLQAWEEGGRGFWSREPSDAARSPRPGLDLRPAGRGADQTPSPPLPGKALSPGSALTRNGSPSVSVQGGSGGQLASGGPPAASPEASLERGPSPSLEQRDSLFFAMDDPIDVRICTDSVYAVRCVTEWVSAWKANGWRTSAGTEVRNRDLIVKIHELLESRKRGSARFSVPRNATLQLQSPEGEQETGGNAESGLAQAWGGRGTVEFMLVRGHSGNYGNEKADELACQGATLPSEGEDENAG
ncbi:putative ribonuclease H [Neospora caninum Liverpool]|uniref:ribonuclease H n=1 Tax=Neospora caninum (strain Liverpool) TaxID=572307 RepID=F0VCU2_NEOCL|nr:putative ribonuclease H [Neospora caninum Liverpool]CBZ51457.1 putative ribonuclease H [Neospora caninum Liverpool]CEL65406.1 TPA: ribonuclease H, putative [Neospora caninum Liverpool]|eukprot:XP_003881490.1 putative ribonuclease H [Neospora caninum Liverpool]